MGEQILMPVRSIRPRWILQARLPAQLVGDPQTLQWTEAGDTVTPIGQLGFARHVPVARHECADAARNHNRILVESRAVAAHGQGATGTRALSERGAARASSPS